MTFDSEPDRLFMACTQLTAVYCCCCYYYYYYYHYYYFNRPIFSRAFNRKISINRLIEQVFD